ncbi:transporter [Aestuariivivens insulae]|uniref:transporter n=1 Tax=Aestuariivivens insulae TaxID=1621988 RepID=UPI001F5A4651|nr:transporter [Aestuariivivens insulae]
METTDKGTLQLALNYDYNYLNTLNFESKKLDDNSRLRITHSILLNIGYAITNNLSAEGLFTWVNQRRKITQFDNENLDQTTGIGDAIFLLKYNFKNAIGENSHLALGIGTKIPLGSSTQKNSDGITLNADLQPGSNAWDLIYWFTTSKNFNFRPSLTISSRLIYRDTGTNNSYLGDSTYQFGEEFQSFLSFSDQFPLLKTITNPSVSFKYRNARQDKINGFNLDNTGGNWLFIIPNFSINITPTISFSTKAELPIYSNVDGTQLTPTYRITSGLLINIHKKTEAININ